MKFSLQSRVMIAMLLMTLVSLLITGVILIQASISEMESSLKVRLQDDLTSKRDILKRSVQDYFDTIEKQIVTMASDVSTVEKVMGFNREFRNYTTQRQPGSFNEEGSVRTYYETSFSTEFKKFNGHIPNTDSLLHAMTAQSTAMQFDFISNNANSLGQKDALTDIGNGTGYDKIHSRYHPSIRNFLKEFGFYDIFFVDAQSGDIVYSVFKELDFATNLHRGPYAKSGIGDAFQQALQLPNGSAYLTDFKPYRPSYDNPASFISTPVFDKNKRIGVLIFQMPIDRINNLMTLNQEWQKAGFGQTGEIYLVGTDGTLRTESRFLIENKERYLESLNTADAQNADKIALKGTGISLHVVDTASTQAGLKGESGFQITTDYRGQKVLSSYAPIDIGNRHWAILSEIDKEEAFQPLDSLTDKVISYTAIIFLILATLSLLTSWFVSKLLVSPLNVIGRHVKQLNSGEADLTRRLPESNIIEINRIGDEFNKFIAQVQALLITIKSEAESVASASTQLSTTIEQTNQTALQQQHEAQQVTFAVEQFNKAIQVVSENSEYASSNTSKTKEYTKENSERAQIATSEITSLVQEVDNSTKKINRLKQEVENINDVLVVINGIADQTNLLALNAAIEAARAGEHGRGFSVVADEVRQLASKTQESTIDIQNKIESLTSVVNESVDSMMSASSYAADGINQVKQVSSSLVDLNVSIEQLAEINISVASSTDEQRSTCESINQNMIRMAESATELSSTSSDVAESSLELSKIAEEMLNITKRFKT